MKGPDIVGKGFCLAQPPSAGVVLFGSQQRSKWRAGTPEVRDVVFLLAVAFSTRCVLKAKSQLEIALTRRA